MPRLALPESLVTVFASQKLAGARVVIRDSTDRDRDATIIASSPLPVSYLIPAGTAAGLATVRIQTAAGSSVHGLSIRPVAPGIFTATPPAKDHRPPRSSTPMLRERSAWRTSSA